MNKKIIIALFAGGLILQSCSRSGGAGTNADQDNSQPQLLNGATEIMFAKDSRQLQQITIDTVREETVQRELSAPAHLVVSVVNSEFGKNSVILFESQDLTQLYSDFISSSSELARATKNLERLRDLSSSKAVAEKELLDVQTEYKQAAADLANKESQLRAAGLDPKDLQQTPAGTVLAIANIPEELVTKIQPDARVELECPAYPGETISGKVSAIGDVIDPNTRTFKVRFVIANPRNKLRAGMYGTAEFIDGRQRVMVLPTTGVVREEDGTMIVWATSDRRRFVQRKVTLGVQEGSKYEITEGLHRGDLVVTDGGLFLSNMLQAQPTD